MRAPSCQSGPSRHMRAEVKQRTVPFWWAPITAPCTQKALRQSEGNPVGGWNRQAPARTTHPSAGRLAPTTKRRATQGVGTHRCRSPTGATEFQTLPRAPAPTRLRNHAAKAPSRRKQPASGTSAPPQARAPLAHDGVAQHLLAPRRRQLARLPPPRPPISVVDSLTLRLES